MTDRLWNLLCSLKLTIILLLLLSVTSIIGTIIQQNASATEYISEYGLSAYKLFRMFQFTDMYHSFWFVGIIGLFCLNLICCSLKNFPKAWRFISKPTLVASPGLLNNSANNAKFTSSKKIDDLTQEISDLLRNEFSAPIITAVDGKRHLFAQKGVYSRFGVYVTHLSILIIIAGAMIGTLWGVKGHIEIVEGEQVDYFWTNNGVKYPLGFSVLCEDFDVIYYQNSNRPKDYYSNLIISENNQPVAIKGLEKTRIEVNKPLTYNNFTFYQSTYGIAGNAPTFSFQITDNSSGKVHELTTSPSTQTSLGNGYSFSINNYTENFRNFGPAVQVVVSAPDGTQSNPFVVLKNYPDFDSKRGGSYSFSLINIDQLQFTGLQVVKDPGVNIVWAGCFFLIFGSLTAFFFSHRRLWICLEEHDNLTKIQFIGNAHRNQPAFSMAFDNLQQKLEASVSNLSSAKEK
jgi:cytochrome c biogenesis protein